MLYCSPASTQQKAFRKLLFLLAQLLCGCLPLLSDNRCDSGAARRAGRVPTSAVVLSRALQSGSTQHASPFVIRLSDRASSAVPAWEPAPAPEEAFSHLLLPQKAHTALLWARLLHRACWHQMWPCATQEQWPHASKHGKHFIIHLPSPSPSPCSPPSSDSSVHSELASDKTKHALFFSYTIFQRNTLSVGAQHLLGCFIQSSLCQQLQCTDAPQPLTAPAWLPRQGTTPFAFSPWADTCTCNPTRGVSQALSSPQFSICAQSISTTPKPSAVSAAVCSKLPGASH